MVSPGDETAGAESQARLRASAADRQQVIEALKVAFVQDRITKDELDQRIGKVLASRTYDDLDVLTADIPGALIRARPAVPARPPDVSKKKLIRGTSVAVAGTGFVIAEAVAHLTPVVGVIAGFVAGVFTAGLLAVLLTLIAWAIDRSAGGSRHRGRHLAHSITLLSIPRRPTLLDSPGRAVIAYGLVPKLPGAVFPARHWQVSGHRSGCLH